MATIAENDIKEYFNLVDADGTGSIRGDQIELLLRALGHNPAKGEAAKYGALDLKGFMQIVPKNRAPITKDAVRASLTTLNVKGGGQFVTKDFLRHLLTQVGDKLTDAEFDEFIADPALEVGSDGRINVKNLVDVLGV